MVFGWGGGGGGGGMAPPASPIPTPMKQWHEGEKSNNSVGCCFCHSFVLTTYVTRVGGGCARGVYSH